MKTLNYIWVLLASIILISCEREEMDINTPIGNEPGIETSISLKVGMHDMDTAITKAGESYEEYLEYVSNLLVVVFNADGSFHLAHEQSYNHNKGTDIVYTNHFYCSIS